MLTYSVFRLKHYKFTVMNTNYIQTIKEHVYTSVLLQRGHSYNVCIQRTGFVITDFNCEL
mgnify:CR=1 FL=1